ncbi:hypothetical protein [Gluconobacter oxydans]|uniref:Uncharacterized protein n=1 Tax=Gluconobacter oxydans TaxID=442 RepID=A0A149S8H6_GLUOY|nr:hypothetical protein [Gluconobacter oxydans]KXV22998.1 hypothetical protein AD934_00745 [Gluconobacter oxydans]
MTSAVSSSDAPVVVNIAPGNSPPAAPTITAAAYNAASQQIVLTFSNGSEVPITGFAAALAQSLGENSLAVLDATGALVLGGKPRLGVSGSGNLTLPTPLPDSTAGYDPIPGTNEIYSQAGSVGVAQ